MKRREEKRMLKKGIWAVLLMVCLTAGLMAGCGDGIKEETVTAVKDKTGQALQLYADIERLVEENELIAQQEFTDMKKQLTEMSAKVSAQVGDTTEEDGQLAIQELDRIIQDLQQVKANVEQSVAETQ